MASDNCVDSLNDRKELPSRYIQISARLLLNCEDGRVRENTQSMVRLVQFRIVPQHYCASWFTSVESRLSSSSGALHALKLFA